MALSDEFADAFVFRNIDIMRFEASERRRVVGLLRELEAELIAALKDVDPTEPARVSAQRERIVMLEAEVYKASARAYRRINRTYEKNLIPLAEMVGEDTVSTANAISGIRLLRGKITEQQAERLAENLLVEGARASEWWDGQAESLSKRFMRVVREKTLVTEEGLTQIIRETKGTAVARYRDGIRPVTQHQAESLVRTGMQQIVNDTRYEVYQQNSDVISGVQASNPLDSNTTLICVARAGAAWTLEGKAMANTTERFPGPPPWHWACRTVLIPIVKPVGSLRRLRGGRGRGIRRRLDRLAVEKKAAINGKPAGGMTFREWLGRHSEVEQKELLGAGRLKLWKNGQITTRDLIDQSGRPLTLEELRERFVHKVK